MIMRITLKEAIRRVHEVKTLADIQTLFKDLFGLSDAQLMGAECIPGLPDPDAPVELTQAAKMANPDYGKGEGYARNCQKCAIAYILLRRGINVTSMPNPYPDRSGTSRRPTLNGSECFHNVKIYGRNHIGGLLNKKDLLTSLYRLPNDAIVVVFWVQANRHGGHVICCEKVNGELKFIDPQSGFVGPEALGAATRENGYCWYRVDGCELNPDFEWEEVVKND